MLQHRRRYVVLEHQHEAQARQRQHRIVYTGPHQLIVPKLFCVGLQRSSAAELVLGLCSTGDPKQREKLGDG